MFKESEYKCSLLNVTIAKASLCRRLSEDLLWEPRQLKRTLYDFEEGHKPRK